MELLETILQHIEFYGKIIISIGATLCAIGLIAVAISILIDEMFFGL